MKKIFTLLTGAAIAMMANAGVPVKVTVDDASHVDYLEYNGNKYTFESNVLEFEAVNYETAYLYLTEPWALQPGCTYTCKPTWSEETWTNEYYQDYKSTVQLYLDPSSYEWYDFTISTVNMVDLRNNACEVNVHGDPSLMRLEYNDTYYTPQLAEGKNTIHFMDSESPIHIYGYDYTYALYQVVWNGEEMIAEDYSWYLDVKGGDVLDIYPEWPDKDVTVTFSFLGDASADDISEFELDYKAVADFSKPVVGKMGQYLSVGIESITKDIVSLKVNGEDYELSPYYPYYTTRLKEDIVLELNMTKKPVWTGHVTVDDCTRIRYQVAGGKYKYPESNEFTIDLPANDSYSSITFMARDGNSKIKSVKVDGVYAYNYDGEYYVSYEKDGQQINILTEAIVRNDAWMFYFDSPEKTRDEAKNLYGWWMDCAMSSRQEELDGMQAGYNYIPSCRADFPFRIGVNAPYEGVLDSYVFAYLNNEPCHLEYQKNISYWTIEPADKDVFKLYVMDEAGVEPAHSSVTFSINDETAVVSTIVDKIKEVAVANNMVIDNQLPGTLYEMTLSEGCTIMVNDAEIEADEDGTYRFTINDNTTVSITKISGIADAAVDAADDGSVYNMLGVKVSDGDVKNLPAGIYLKKGSKIYVK